ncbi:MAG: hypothetical protein K2H83_02635 [Duncaniella sp.]|nr:hypothetical protein [Duncaniella sp.]
MSKLVIYLIVGAVILIYNWIAGVVKEHTRRQGARRDAEENRSVAMPGEPDEDPWAVFERNLTHTAAPASRAEGHIAEARGGGALSHIAEAAPPHRAEPPQAERPKTRKPRPKAAPAVEEGTRVTDTAPEISEAVKAERKRNAALRAHYDRWRQAMIDRQVLEQKF